MKILLSIILFSFYINSKSQITIQSLADNSGNSSLEITNNLEFGALGISNYAFVLNNANLSSPLLLTNSLNYKKQRIVFSLDTNFNSKVIHIGTKKLSESDIDYTNESLNFDAGVKCFLTGEHIKTRNNSRLFVVNTLDTTKKVFIDSLQPLGFRRLETELYSGIKTKHYDSGHIYDVYQDTIYISRGFYQYEEYERNLTYIYHSENLRILNSTYNYTLSFNDSLELQYSNSFRYSSHYFAKNIGLISFGSAAIVAPLFSINYSDGGFNENRYFRVAGYSMSATAICAIVYLMTFDKKFKLVKKGTEVNKNYWYLDYY